MWGLASKRVMLGEQKFQSIFHNSYNYLIIWDGELHIRE